MEYSEEVKKLAETLKNSGLAASMRDALEKAQSMLSKKEVKEKEEPFEKKEDAAQTTLGEVKEKEKEEIGESPETKDELKKEEVFTNNPNKQKQESNQNKINYSIVPNSSSRARTKEKKVDLTEVFDVHK